ncbi:hypothetical protein PFICI_08698 [Pestalotiopsis fici W106-1]|uniref:Uncharacterized protein n=1 Tax=Pestalotiopsis fici (strain W106-1 / CGMCC3.15140) TaxID=1229662 RepID=W3WYC3_PESFW|nr:uncharacterized protein PFICI_08698 [Pestalotiopsis fici W106-1]ETS78845.1 hypothetical protein PFICI_08698 [Pestalotiopsis fici W106-1]
MLPQQILATIALTTSASASAMNMRRAADPIMGPATCGVGGKERYLDHDDLVKTVEEFAAWVERGANGQVDAAGKFHYSLHYDSDDVTLFACDYKSNSAGSVITGQLIRKALGSNGWLDQQCNTDNAGYERSNDLSVGRTFVSSYSLPLVLVDTWN